MNERNSVPFNFGRYSDNLGLARVPILASMLAIVFGVMVLGAQAQNLTVLYSFAGGLDGQYPAGVIVDSHGNLYGATLYGGTFNWGTVFTMSMRGKKTVLYNFTGGVDGGIPSGEFITDANGNFYSITVAGGDLSCSTGSLPGCGTVFKLSSTGKETVLHSFSGTPTDGDSPSSPLVRDGRGNFYGTTYGGGSSMLGTVYKLSSTGTVTVLHSFTGTPYSENPAGVLRDTSGNLYGAAAGGANYWGTVWEVDSNGKETILYNFTGGTDGGYPNGGLLRDASGNLYGTTQQSSGGSGVIFKLDSSGNQTVLHTFGGLNDGKDPGSLLRDSAGNLYGVTSTGGEYDWGTVFKFDTAGNETVLYSFTGTKDGQYPTSLVLGRGGDLYGTTQNGGRYGWGTVFKLKP